MSTQVHGQPCSCSIHAGDNRCIVCGDIIPEGRMICPQCESAAQLDHWHVGSYLDRRLVYANALAKFGERGQLIVALEELSECQKEICKILRGGSDYRHLAEEIADAQIMLEQVTMIYDLGDCVENIADEKIKRLDRRCRG